MADLHILCRMCTSTFRAQRGWPVFLGRSPAVRFSPPKAAFMLAPERAPTSPAGTVSQPIGKPFNGQANGQLSLTWRSYAGPPQSINLPRAKALNPPVRRSRSQAAPLAPKAVRPGGAINPHARKGVSTYGNTGKHRPGPSPDRAAGVSYFINLAISSKNMFFCR